MCMWHRLPGAAGRQAHAGNGRLPGLEGGGASRLLPSFIKGDLDSLRQDVAQYYRDRVSRLVCGGMGALAREGRQPSRFRRAALPVRAGGRRTCQ